jgi:hypothetical protein
MGRKPPPHPPHPTTTQELSLLLLERERFITSIHWKKYFHSYS